MISSLTHVYHTCFPVTVVTLWFLHIDNPNIYQSLRVIRWSRVVVSKAPFAILSIEEIFDFAKILVGSLNHWHIRQVSPQLNCVDTCQIWTRYLIGSQCLKWWKIGKISEQRKLVYWPTPQDNMVDIRLPITMKKCLKYGHQLTQWSLKFICGMFRSFTENLLFGIHNNKIPNTNSITSVIIAILMITITKIHYWLCFIGTFVIFVDLYALIYYRQLVILCDD